MYRPRVSKPDDGGAWVEVDRRRYEKKKIEISESSDVYPCDFVSDPHLNVGKLICEGVKKDTTS